MISRADLGIYPDQSVSQQIASAIRDRIAAGKLQTGDHLPGERVLAERLGYARDTVKRAYEILADEGLAVRQHGKPVLVRVPPPVRLMDNQRYEAALRRAQAGIVDPDQTSFCQDYRIGWSDYTVDSARFDRMPPTDFHIEYLRLPGRPDVLRREMVQHARGVPVQIHRSVMLAATVMDTPVADPDRQPWPDGTIAELYSLNYTVAAVYERLRSRPATPWEAGKLGLPAHHQVLDVVRQFVVADQAIGVRAVEVSEVVMPAAGNTLQWATHINPSLD